MSLNSEIPEVAESVFGTSDIGNRIFRDDGLEGPAFGQLVAVRSVYASLNLKIPFPCNGRIPMT